MKLALRLGVALVALVIVVVLAAYAFMDSAAQAAIERGATSALGVKTTLSAADVKAFSGEFAMSGLQIANSPGFTDQPFLTLDSGSVAVSLGTLRSDPIELPHLRLTGLTMVIDRKKGDSNYGAILDHLQKNRTPASGSSSSSSAGPNFLIHEVTIRDVVAHVSFSPIGADPTVLTVPIEEISLKDVGADRPLPLSEVAGVIVQAVLATVVQQGGSLLPEDLLTDLNGSLSQLGDLSDFGISIASDLGEQAQKMIDDATKHLDGQTKQAVDDVKKKIEGIGRDLFKKKKNKGG